MRRLLRLTAFALTTLRLSSAQEMKIASGEPEAMVAPRTIPLQVGSTLEVVSVSDPFLTLPLFCGSDRTTFVRMAGMSGVSDLTSISNDGKTVIRFQSDKINDVVNPKTRAFFVTQSDVFMLTTGSIPQANSLQLQKPNGEVERQRAVTTQQFVVRFGRDGSYRGAVRLDMAFTPYQIGVFPNGDFLLAGATRDNQVRVALVKSNGQFHRYVELQGDIELKENPERAGGEGSPMALPLTGKRFGEGFQDVVQVSFISPDGPNLLLVRKIPSAPIFSISPGGAVQTVKPHLPQGYTLADLKASQRPWIGSSTRRISDEAGLAFATYALDPVSGEIIQEYAYPKFLGMGLACADGVEFSFLTREDDKLKIVKLSPATSPAP